MWSNLWGGVCVGIVLASSSLGEDRWKGHNKKTTEKSSHPFFFFFLRGKEKPLKILCYCSKLIFLGPSVSYWRRQIDVKQFFLSLNFMGMAEIFWLNNTSAQIIPVVWWGLKDTPQESWEEACPPALTYWSLFFPFFFFEFLLFEQIYLHQS